MSLSRWAAGGVDISCHALRLNVIVLAAILSILVHPCAAQGANMQGEAENPQAASEVKELRDEVQELRAEVERLRSLITGGAAQAQSASSDAVAPTASTTARGTPQYSGQPDTPGLAIATKANGGDLSGIGNLLRTDRLTLGGYGDFQFREPGLNERNDGGGTATFQNTRLVLGLAAVLSRKQNIVFNTEIEYELGASEIDVEQAFVDWKMRPEFSFRGGILVPSLGRFNTYHDSNLNLLTLRPLMNQYVIPTAYRDAGIGVRGRISLPKEMKLTYEADIVNGMQGFDDEGEPTPFSRIVGQSSAAEPVSIAFQDNNTNKAFIGRLGFSPLLGLEFGVSGYNGKFNNIGEAPASANIMVVDGSYQRGAWTVEGEYARSNIVGQGIPRRSPPPPASIAALAEFVAQRTPGQDGFYVESAYKFRPGGFLRERFDNEAYVSPVLRVEGVRLDRTLSNFYLNRSRVTAGLNIAPSEAVIFKFGYAFNHTFGKVPNVAGPVGGADFDNNPIPYRDYGKDGFVGSVAYVF